MRSEVVSAKRIVVKVGSSSISGGNAGNIHLIVDALAGAFSRGIEVVLVTSGAIATALPILGLTGRPDDLPGQQAAAAVGQNMLMNRYQDSLNRHEIVAAQVLLTAGDLDHPSNRQNAQLALDRLLGMRMFPIINENDTVATAEIRFGDNDRLAALVAELVGADLLFCCLTLTLCTQSRRTLRGPSALSLSPRVTTFRASRSAKSVPRVSEPGEPRQRSQRQSTPAPRAFP